MSSTASPASRIITHAAAQAAAGRMLTRARPTLDELRARVRRARLALVEIECDLHDAIDDWRAGGPRRGIHRRRALLLCVDRRAAQAAFQAAQDAYGDALLARDCPQFFTHA